MTSSPIPTEGGHTPGPWRVGQLASYDAMTGRPCRFVYRGDCESAETRIRINGGDGENGAQFNCDADAHLIAAAPALVAVARQAAARFREYEALHAAKPDPEKARRNAEIAEQIESVLALATGGEDGR